MKQHHLGWLLLAVVAGLLLWFVTRKSKQSVTSKIVLKWNSSTDQHAPSFDEAPPLQLPDGTLTCAPGWSLWKDDATGNYACYKDATSHQPLSAVQPPTQQDAALPVSSNGAGSTDRNFRSRFFDETL